MSEYKKPPSKAGVLGNLTISFLSDGRVNFYPEAPFENALELAAHFSQLCC